ncbi:glycosyltransferase [Intrasporangium chromatireducens]|uniref:glycosyltransferase n=1 Tax=Intrasporangium chromatireducens TaxID=1386088 RepID=UPI001F0A83EA|nr:glycosyltransferase [Intrasporangium chromatireducens]
MDESLEELIHPRAEVVRVPFSWPYPVEDRTEWSMARRLAPRLWWHARVLLDQVPFPEPVYGPWRRQLEGSALDVHARRPVDLVVATANPHVDFTAARVLHRRHAVPYVLDYRDAWLLDVFTGEQVHADRSRQARAEAEFVKHAHEVWFVNEPIRAWHAARYPEAAARMHVVANGFDPELAPIPRIDNSSTEPLRFGYVGTVSRKVPLERFAEAWSLARQQSAALRDATAEFWGYLGFHSLSDPGIERVFSRHTQDGVTYMGPLRRADVRATYERFDALLLILGSGRYVTSGKVYEYLASGLPIVSVHAPDNAASDVMRGYPLWFPTNTLEAEAVAQALQAAGRAALESKADVRRAAARFGRSFERGHQLSPRIEALAASLRV